MTTEAYHIWSLVFSLFTALGTVGAVVVALYLSKTGGYPQISVYARTARLHNMPGIPSSQQFVEVAATNIGIMEEHVETFGYQIGLLGRFKHFVQVNPSDTRLTRSFPSNIKPGERACDLIEIERFDKLQLPFFINYLNDVGLPLWIKRHRLFPFIFMRTVKCWVNPVRGKLIYGKLQRTLTNHIIDSYNNKKTVSEINPL